MEWYLGGLRWEWIYFAHEKNKNSLKWQADCIDFSKFTDFLLFSSIAGNKLPSPWVWAGLRNSVVRNRIKQKWGPATLNTRSRKVPPLPACSFPFRPFALRKARLCIKDTQATCGDAHMIRNEGLLPAPRWVGHFESTYSQSSLQMIS